MKRIGIFHDEFTRTHDAEARPNLIAKLGLNLIKVNRQLAITFNLTPHDVGNHFLVGWAKTKIPIVTILNLQHLRAELRPTPRFLPQLRRLHGGHQQLYGAARVHLLAHHVFDLAQHAQTEWHPTIQTRTELLDEPRS